MPFDDDFEWFEVEEKKEEEEKEEEYDPYGEEEFFDEEESETSNQPTTTFSHGCIYHGKKFNLYNNGANIL